jgi:hypothetical protein
MPLVAALAVVLMAAASAVLGGDIDQLGRERSEAFLAGDVEAVWQEMTPAMQQAFGTIDELKDFRAQLEQDFGEETRVVSEEVKPGGEGVELYLRTSTWSKTDATVLMQWAFDADEKVAGFLVKPVPVLAEPLPRLRDQGRAAPALRRGMVRRLGREGAGAELPRRRSRPALCHGHADLPGRRDP